MLENISNKVTGAISGIFKKTTAEEQKVVDFTNQVEHVKTAYDETSKQLLLAGTALPEVATGSLMNFIKLISAAGIECGLTPKEVKTYMSDALKRTSFLVDAIYADYAEYKSSAEVQ